MLTEFLFDSHVYRFIIGSRYRNVFTFTLVLNTEADTSKETIRLKGASGLSCTQTCHLTSFSRLPQDVAPFTLASVVLNGFPEVSFVPFDLQGTNCGLPVDECTLNRWKLSDTRYIWGASCGQIEDLREGMVLIFPVF